MIDKLYFDIETIENLCNKVISNIGKEENDPLDLIPLDKIQEYKDRLIKHCSNAELVESSFLSEFEISNFPISEIKSMQTFYEEIYRKLCKNTDSSDLNEEKEETDFEKTLYNIIIFLAKIVAKDNNDSLES